MITICFAGILLNVAAVGYWMVINNIYFIDLSKKIRHRDKEQAAQFFAAVLCWHDIWKVCSFLPATIPS